MWISDFNTSCIWGGEQRVKISDVQKDAAVQHTVVLYWNPQYGNCSAYVGASHFSMLYTTDSHKMMSHHEN
jgi:hypothetical protein